MPLQQQISICRELHWRKASKYEKPNFGDRTSNIYANTYRETTRKWEGSWNILVKWKGSVYKLIWHDLLIFLLCYFVLMILYHTVLTNENLCDPIQKQRFELMCIYAKRFSGSIPIALLTGFYVTSVVSRWWDQFMALPYPDKLALKLVAFIPGHSKQLKNLRRTVMRYVNLSSILAYTKITSSLAKKFPTYNSFIENKIMLEHEVERIKRVDQRSPHESSWTPLLWAMKLITQAKEDGLIKIAEPVFANLQSSFSEIEDSNRKMLSYGWVNFPLAYTQVAHLAVFTYFGSCLFSKQFLIPPDNALDKENFPNVTNIAYGKAPFDNHTPGFFMPIFTIIEMICYMGWIKVAESLLNPFGDDDEDFNIKYLIERNLQVSYLIVDEADEDIELVKGPFEFSELPTCFDDEPDSKLTKNDLTKSKISIAVSNASEVPLEICKIDCTKKEDVGSKGKDHQFAPCDEEDSHQVSLLMDDEKKEQHNM